MNYKPLEVTLRSIAGMCVIILIIAMLSSCFFNPLEKFQAAYPRNIIPIYSDENVSFSLA